MIGGDTIAALATPRGRGGVAVIRVSGSEAFAIAEKLTGRRVGKEDAGRFFHVEFSGSGRVLDDGLMLVFASPRSYTGEDVVELQTHGGEMAPQRVLDALLAAGARLAGRGEFTRRAFLNGRLDLSQAEAVIDLIDARTGKSADDALGRLRGALSGAFGGLYDRLLEVSGRIEHALDFDEEELPGDFHSGLQTDIGAVLNGVEVLLSTAREGRLLREGASVVLAGRPNAGKSSLMNALLGEDRVIVSDIPGTTRDSIEEALDIRGWPVRLQDTAGIRKTGDELEAQGVDRSEKLMAQADLVLMLSEDGKDFSLADGLAPAAAVKVLTKSDLYPYRTPDDGVVEVSSATGDGLEELKRIIAEKLSVLAAKSDESGNTDITSRQVESLCIAGDALKRALDALAVREYVIAANEAAAAAEAIGRLLGKVYHEDLLDAVFSSFCVGK